MGPLNAVDEAQQTPPGANSEERPGEDDPFTYTATALAALVGSVVAIAFGLKPSGETKTEPDWVGRLIVIYAIVYIVFGVGAVVTWVLRQGCTPPLSKTLASTFLGLLVPIVANFFRQSSLADVLSRSRNP